MAKQHDAFVAALVGHAQLGSVTKIDARTLGRHSHDQSYHAAKPPIAVVQVRSEEHVAALVRLANIHNVPIVSFAAGSSLEGQTLAPATGAVVADFSEMDRVVAVHAEDLDCVVEPGVGWSELREHLKPSGVFFPPDPGAAACIGGMCGTNCSGTLAFKYGTMKDNVLSLRVVMADGSIIKTRNRAVKSSAGYDLTRLFVGSEGTLGIITQATLRLRRLPTHSNIAIAQFPSLADSASAVQRLVHSGAPFMRLELIDDVCIDAVNNEIESPALKFARLTTILAECAGISESDVTEQIDAFKLACSSAATSISIATTQQESDRLWSLRKRAFFMAPSLRHHEVGKEFATIVTDVAVPISRLVDILVATRKLIANARLVAPIVAHAGDGNFHCLIVVDKNDADEFQRAKHFRDQMARLALDMQGTCTGEHGIGIGKQHLLEEELGPGAIQVMRKIKKALDPKNILNPGKVVGSGAFGLSAALSLQKRGHSVTVFDRLPIPAQDAASTDISKVIRPDYADQALYQKLALASIEKFKHEWNPDAKRRFGKELYIECGTVYATKDTGMNDFERASIATLKSSGVETKILNKDDITAIYGSGFGNEYQGGYLNPRAGYADSGLTMQYLAQIASESGVKFLTGPQAGTFVDLIKNGSGATIGITTSDRNRHYADLVLVAAGSWTPSLLPQLQGLCEVTAQPVIHIKIPDNLKHKFDASKYPVWFADVSKTGFYGFPISPTTGELKFANHGPGFTSSFHVDTRPGKTGGNVGERKKWLTNVTPTDIPKEAVSKYRKFLKSAFPELNKFDITRTRLCWYCESWDGNFYIDAVPGAQNVFVATGGSGHGFKFVPKLGDVIADIVEGKPTEFKDLFKWRTKPDDVKFGDEMRATMSDRPSNLDIQELSTLTDLKAKL
ncbi:hypothetical protein HK100_003366 [Physocladia obscura]|uniref:D-lactate dehydrogenase (cytochrome) n=1 Tax=Physocladia obscura TaxID=109957 RepID=A0AAD5SVS9_9FUNG|nr:hypothetical protein HK100_003366 [Physocladia obscura]